MNPLFGTIPAPKLKRNNFSLSHRNYMTLPQHKLCVSMIKEVLPGDIFNVRLESFARVAPMVAPPLSAISLSHHAFYVPMRTLSKVWPDFITGGREGNNTKVLPYTYIKNIVTQIYALNTATKYEESYSVIRMLDFMGVNFDYPTNLSSVENFVKDFYTKNSSLYLSEVPVNLLPFLAYQKIYDEYYRDQNLEASVMDSIRTWLSEDAYGYQSLNFSNTGCLALFTFRGRAWKKDRFTSALPFTQRGPEVYLPLAGSAPVSFRAQSGTIPTAAGVTVTGTGAAATPYIGPAELGIESADAGARVKADVDLSDAELLTTINTFREAERLQSFYERDARGGSRLNENNLAHWGVPTLDATLDRAEFLGGLRVPVVVSEVEQTSASSTTPQGNLAGKASAYDNSSLCKRFFREHGYIIVLTSIMSEAVYSQGLDKIFSRQERIDYAWNEFGHLGEEPILKKEVYLKSSDPDGVFGYTPRYSDYKSALSEVHSDFKGSLSFWLQQRKFANEPTLSKQFMFSDPDNNIFAVTSTVVDHFMCVFNFGIRASRLLPFYGTPSL